MPPTFPVRGPRREATSGGRPRLERGHVPGDGRLRRHPPKEGAPKHLPAPLRGTATTGNRMTGVDNGLFFSENDQAKPCSMRIRVSPNPKGVQGRSPRSREAQVPKTDAPLSGPLSPDPSLQTLRRPLSRPLSGPLSRPLSPDPPQTLSRPLSGIRMRFQPTPTTKHIRPLKTSPRRIRL
ncbi:hypothetical protein M885DRAFT_546215 [Pelagophyceae sp. CCMP2097]|nr:hypothetical protein M885DRAFT_546215 [Pelagophyceae sp. CCMP2097]